MFTFRSLLCCAVICSVSGCAEDVATKVPAIKITDAEVKAIKSLQDAGATVKVEERGAATEVSFAKLDPSAESLRLLSDLKSLRTLNLSDSTFNDDLIASLEPFSSQLTSLDLRGCELSDKSAPGIARLTALRALRFSGKNGKTTISDDGLKLIGACKSLKVLALDDLWIGSRGLEILSGLPELEELYLAGTVVDDDSCKLIAVCPKLRKLRLARTQVGDAALATLATCRHLEELDLSENSLISNAGMSHLAKLTSLKKLNLWRVQISDEGALLLAPLTKLEWLNLDNSKLADAGLPLLKDMTSLTFLHLGSTQVTEAGAPALFHLKSLKDLKITRTALGSSTTAVAELKKNLPATSIQTEYIAAE